MSVRANERIRQNVWVLLVVAGNWSQTWPWHAHTGQRGAGQELTRWLLAQNENVPFLQSENVPFLVLSREGFTDGFGDIGDEPGRARAGVFDATDCATADVAEGGCGAAWDWRPAGEVANAGVAPRE